MNAGDTGFMMICAAMVFFMTPGLAFFYGGLVRRKNVVNTMLASDGAVCGDVGVVWLFVVIWRQSCRYYRRFQMVCIKRNCYE